ERGRSARRTWQPVATAGAACVFGAELVHGLVGLSIRWEAAATHAFALGAGAWWAKRRLALLSQTLRGETRALAGLAAYAARLRGRWSHLWPAIWLAWGIEAAHLVIADRYFDVTNALISCAGLGIGWLALRRSGFAPHGEALAPLIPR